MYDVTSSRHILFLIERPSLFRMSGQRILEVYRKYEEVVGTEAKAREELIREATLLGWIRVRHYSKPTDRWTIQCDDTSARKKTITEFLRWGVEKGVVRKDDSALIEGFNNPQDTHVYLWQDGGIAQYLPK